MHKTKIIAREIVSDGYLIDLYKCPRCNKMHKNLKTKTFDEAAEVKEVIFKYYSTCPKKKEPILIDGFEYDIPLRTS